MKCLDRALPRAGRLTPRSKVRRYGKRGILNGLPRARLRRDLVSEFDDPRATASPPSRLGESVDELSANVLARRDAPETA